MPHHPNSSKRLRRSISLVGLLLLTNLICVIDSHALDFGRGANADIRAIKLQRDGKIVIAGDFTEFNGIPRSRIARLNNNGRVDPTFAPQVNGSIRAMVIQKDGKIVIGGDFVTVGDDRHVRIARLNADGSTDDTFNVSVDSSFNVLTLQADEKILLGGGDFKAINDVPRSRIGRLNADGTLDTAFNVSITGSKVSNVRAIVAQANDKILIAVDDATVNGVARARHARLNSNGSLDSNFSNSDIDFSIRSFAIQADGKILAGSRRLNTNGTIDSTYEIKDQGREYIQSPVAIQWQVYYCRQFHAR